MSDMRTIAAFLLIHEIVAEELCLSWGERLAVAVPDLIERLRALPNPSSDVDVQTVFYDIGKQYIGETKDDLRKYFEVLYCIFQGSHTGSRWGMMYNILGKEDFLWRLENNFDNLMLMSVRKA